MTLGVFSRIIDDAKHRQDELKSNEYVMVNVRPGPKITQ